ncbi:hypothetical protein [uncultured Nitratireductor sp.]|uniref:hypothetical protein n=1 Tax=uncultured Nitratireductor sp. TaxID=520953 RepID=UPI00260FE5AE|nr:hypothetical protein [uncultured Nitratireductor sp.]
MSKTHRFNTTVSLGAKTFPPGADVPLGGKNGLSAEEVAKLEKEFGVWKAGENAARPDGEAAATIAAMEKEAKALSDRVAELEQKLAEVSEERDTLAEDNQLLADRLKELEAPAVNGGENGKET